MNPIANGKEKL